MLKKNLFMFKSTSLISEIYFSTPKDFNTFEKFSNDYLWLIENKGSGFDDPDPAYNKRKLNLQSAFLNFEHIDTLINNAFRKEGISVEAKTAFSILRTESSINNKWDQIENTQQLSANELILFGNIPDFNTNSFYLFHHTLGDYYYQCKLYIDFPKIWKYLFYEMKDLLIGIIVVMVIIFSIFTYTIQTIIKQKKLADIKNDFINNMTHELNTPISTIRVAGQNLLKEEIKQKPELVNDLALTIIRQNKRLQKIVSDVMEASLNDAELINLKLNEYPLHKLLTEIIADFLTANQDKEFQIEHQFKAQSDLIKLDIFYFTSAIFNLLDNAVKYSRQPTKIQISTENTNEELILKIKDNGIGIPTRDQGLIFDKFYRVVQGNIHAVKGLGLGLYIVNQIVKAHHAQIKFISKTGEGSTFIIEIPYS